MTVVKINYKRLSVSKPRFRRYKHFFCLCLLTFNEHFVVNFSVSTVYGCFAVTLRFYLSHVLTVGGAFELKVAVLYSILIDTLELVSICLHVPSITMVLVIFIVFVPLLNPVMNASTSVLV